MEKKIAVVTGASSGIGKTIVEALSDFRVVPISRSSDPSYDLTEFKTPQWLLDEPRIDLLVHAAAIAEQHTVADSEVADWHNQFDLNVIAPAILTRDLLPAIRKAQGTVVFINSGAGNGAYPGNVIYAATKHALHGLADALRKEEPQIRVATVAPGPTDTPMLQGLITENYQPEHYIAPQEVAEAVRFAATAGPSTQITRIDVRPRIELADREE